MATPRTSQHLAEWLHVLGWEFAQNVPVVLGLVLAVWLWPRGMVAAAIACVVAGGLLSAGILRATEPAKAQRADAREPWRLTLLNAACFSGMGILVAAYFGALTPVWSPAYLALDAGLGLLLGGTLAVLQAAAARGSRAFTSRRAEARHAAALLIACPIVLLLIRLCTLPWLDLAPALALALPITLILGLVISAEYVGPRSSP